MEGKTNMKVFVYKQADPQPLRMWVCYPEGWKASDKRAGMVFFCGGAWSHADHNEFVPWASYLTSRGMVTGVAEYRPKGAITCDEDATSAIRWFRAHCAELGVDPKRIGASGGSAGGQMAAYAAMCEPRNSPNEDVSVSAKPNVLVLFDAVLDMNTERGAGGLSAQDKVSVSPIYHMAKDTVPTLLFYGTECPFVGQARAFLAKSKTLGNLVQLYTAPGGGHVYYFRQPWRQLTFGHMDEFLVSLGYLNGAATIKVDTDLKHTNENVSPPASQPQAQSAPIGSAPARGDLGRPPAATGAAQAVYPAADSPARPAPSADAAWTQTSRAPEKVLTFKKATGPDGQDQELKLHVYLPEGWKASDKRPAIILWFGGAFVMGDPKQFFPQAEYFASRGMVGISGEYRIKMGVSVSTEDARSAIRWMKTHAAELGIDPNKIAAGGGSAGGYLGTAVGTNVGLDAKGEDKTVSARPAALVLFNPALRAGGASSPGAASSSAPAPAPGRAGRTGMDLAPPLDALSKDCPPSILFYGTTDNFIGPGRAFSEKALSLGVRSELWAAQAQGHGFFNGEPWTQATLEKADLFLASLGVLKGSPTVKVDPKAVLVRQVPADADTQPTTRLSSPELPQPAPAAGKPAPAGDPAGRADAGKLLSVYEARVYKDAQGRSLNYRLLKPLDYDPKTKYPLVLFMHGKGRSQGEDNQAQITAPGVTPAVTLFADPQVRQQFPPFVIVPQAPQVRKDDLGALLKQHMESDEGFRRSIHPLLSELAVLHAQVPRQTTHGPQIAIGDNIRQIQGDNNKQL